MHTLSQQNPSTGNIPTHFFSLFVQATLFTLLVCSQQHVGNCVGSARIKFLAFRRRSRAVSFHSMVGGLVVRRRLFAVHDSRTQRLGSFFCKAKKIWKSEQRLYLILTTPCLSSTLRLPLYCDPVFLGNSFSSLRSIAAAA